MLLLDPGAGSRLHLLPDEGDGNDAQSAEGDRQVAVGILHAEISGGGGSVFGAGRADVCPVGGFEGRKFLFAISRKEEATSSGTHVHWYYM